VVIDPIMAFLEATVATGSDPSVRQALLPLMRLAEKHRCAVLLVRHLNKDGGVQSIYRGGGSIGIIGACRSGWLVARDPHDPSRRVLAEVKNNLAAPQSSLSFAIEAPDSGPASIAWLGPSPWTADQLGRCSRASTRSPRWPRRRSSFTSVSWRSRRPIPRSLQQRGKRRSTATWGQSAPPRPPPRATPPST
jgi:hypothetical protein